MFGNAFKPRAHYVYNYKPRYYDERKERLEKLKEKYKDKNNEPSDIPKITLTKDQLRSSWQRHKRASSDRATTIRLAIIIAILVGLFAYLFDLHKMF